MADSQYNRNVCKANYASSELYLTSFQNEAECEDLIRHFHIAHETLWSPKIFMKLTLRTLCITSGYYSHPKRRRKQCLSYFLLGRGAGR